MGPVTATVARPNLDTFRIHAALTVAEFRRYATYRQAVIAAMVANVVFGFLCCFVLIAVSAGAVAVAVAGAGTAVGVAVGAIGAVAFDLDATAASLRDLSVVEPDIEDVVARPYRAQRRRYGF